MKVSIVKMVRLRLLLKTSPPFEWPTGGFKLKAEVLNISLTALICRISSVVGAAAVLKRLTY